MVPYRFQGELTARRCGGCKRRSRAHGLATLLLVIPDPPISRRDTHPNSALRLLSQPPADGA
jgi:hypothetical protein